MTPPLICTPVRPDEIAAGDGEKVAQAIEALCRVSKDTFSARAGDRISLLPFQTDLLGRLFARTADGRLRHRVGLVGMPRRNGKSTLASGIAIYRLLFGGMGSEVYGAATDRQQAKIVFGDARRMVELEPALSKRLTVYRDAIEHPASGSIFRAISADALSQEGLNVSTAVIDEYHAHRSSDLFDTLALATGSRVDPLVLVISTAGRMTGRLGHDSPCFALYKHGVDVAEGRTDDPTFFMSWWGAPARADHTSEAVWRAANPGYATLVDPADFASAVRRTSEAEFKTKRCNAWVHSSIAWLKAGTFEALANPDRRLEKGEPLVLGVDASLTGDSTVIVAVSVRKPHHADILGIWENSDQDPDFRVPLGEVADAIREAHRHYKLRQVRYDPRFFEATAQALAAEGVRMVTIPQSVPLLERATKRAYDLITDGQVTHSGHRALVEHVRNAVTKVGPDGGQRLVKASKSGMRRVDAAQALSWALDGASVEKVGLGYVVDLNTVVSDEEAAEIREWADQIAADVFGTEVRS